MKADLEKLNRKEKLLAESPNLNKHEHKNLRPRGNLGQVEERVR